MIGIVIVSHSRGLGEGVRELAEQMTKGRVPLAVAAGVDDPSAPLGTDAIAIMEAISGLDAPEGVLILMDLGSALLSAETALELLDPDVAERVRLSPAPLVEGVMAAATASAAGLGLDAVEAEALSALAAKRAQLGQAEAEPSAATVDMPAPGSLSAQARVEIPHGLHARPAAALVLAMSGLDAAVTLSCGGDTADARSLNGIACLNVRQGDTVTLHAHGPEAARAIEAFEALAARDFDEDRASTPSAPSTPAPEPEAPKAPPAEGALVGLPISPGVVRGPVAHFQPQMPGVPARPFEGEAAELARLERAEEQVRAAIEAERAGANPEGAKILRAHGLMIEDPELRTSLREAIRSKKIIAEQAWLSTIEALAARYRSLNTAYLREREADVWDVGRRVMSVLTGTPAARLKLTVPSILVARDLSPSEALQLDPKLVLGLCLCEGGRTSHSAILARSMGLPTIARVAGALDQTRPGQEVGLDARAGLLWLDLDDDQTADLDAAEEEWRAELAEQAAHASAPAETRSGERILVLANISGPTELAAALEAGAEGVGLLRTELLFQQQDSLPTEDEQFALYRQIAAGLGGRPLTIRSLDIGADKPLSSYPVPPEDNPALGRRGVRLCLADPALFKSQLRAVLRVAAEFSGLKLMVPMVALPYELVRSRALLDECRRELQLSPEAAPLPVGAMIEVPSAALATDQLVELADFFSIGTNDLTQYIMGADRGDPTLAELNDYRHPAVRRAIALCAEAARAAGRPLGMCGEMAADPEQAGWLIRVGLSSLSASAPAIPGLKAAIRALP